ncbi:hypothetical protein [Frigoribacterium sp. PhB24]|uniref:hypothetical protein n=1 Tax=Frigoribacterium sp. PhB24 TaxID=2485204 RepID=UPI000F47CBC8|nr:hypothetical protein [Frigoribacterium sp. PhB24]ROS52952.1 hypothetical protein EDF50_1429 [Frigoribacterium sp. PhB24]
MPTGYTADLHDGKDQTFAEFAMSCARGFGALVEMRDAGPDAVVPERFEPDQYAKERLERARADLAEAEARPMDEWAALLTKNNEEMAEASQRARERSRALRVRYEAMLEAVDCWVPPSTEHEQLQSFMRDQLEGSIKFDCSAADDFFLPRVMTPGAFRDDQIGRAKAELTRATKGWGDAVARANQRTWWVRQLRESLAGA